MNGEPSVDLPRVGRSSFGSTLLRGQNIGEIESDDQRSAGFEEIASKGHRAPPAITVDARSIALRIRGYVPHRQRWPFIAVRICASVGLGVFASNSADFTIIPL